MADLTTVESVAGIAVAVHFVTDVRTGTDPFKHLIAGGMVMGFLAFITLVDVDLALAFAALFLVVSLVNKADPVAKVFSGIVSSSPK